MPICHNFKKSKHQTETNLKILFSFFFRKLVFLGLPLFFVKFSQDINNLSSFIFAAIKANRVGQSLSSAFFASHKLRRFQRMMCSSVPRMRTGASHSYYHIICNYTQLSVLRKANNVSAKSFPMDVAEAVFDYFFKMFFGAVAFVLVKAVFGIFLVHIH